MPGPDGDVQVTYALDHLAEHLSAAGRIDDLRCLITPAWLDKKRRHLGVDAYRSLARDVAVALRAVPASPADLPAFLRLCVLASTLNALVTDLPPESLRALAEAGQANQALAAVAMMIGRDRQARALHAIAQGRAQAAPSAAIDLWQQAESLVPGIEDPAQAGRLLAAIGRGLTGLAANDRVEAILARANTYLGHAVEEEAAHSWLLVSDGFADIAAASMDLGERQLATRYLDAAYVALRNADQELYPDTHRFTETFRTIVSLTARAGDTASLDRIGQTITDALERKTDARPPLFAQYGRARIALAAFAIGAADAGDLDRARWALIKALEAGSTEIYRPAVADSLAGLRHGVRLSAGADLMEVSTSRIRRATDPLAAQRLAVDEASMIAWAVAVLSPTDPPGPVAAAVAQVDSAMDRLAGEEERQRARTRWGPGRYDALLRQDRQYDPAVLRDEQLDNRVLRCIAQARCAGALGAPGRSNRQPPASPRQ